MPHLMYSSVEENHHPIHKSNINQQQTLLKDGYQLFWTVQNAGLFPLNTPVSIIFISLAFQTRQLSNIGVRLFQMAFGNKGRYPFHMSCDGHNSYLGSMRNDSTRASVVPNAGPTTQSNHTYYYQGMDVHYIPFLGEHSTIVSS